MKTGKSKDHLQRVFLRFLYLIMGSILSLDSVMAQENLKVSGQVTDNKGEAIIGASVKVLKTGTGTISDMDGKFTIQVPVGAELEIGYVGYNPKRVKVVNKNFVTINGKTNCSTFTKHFVPNLILLTQNKMCILLRWFHLFSSFVYLCISLA